MNRDPRPKPLYSMRTAMARMSPPRLALHRFLWWAYWPFADFGPARYLWGQYRRTWPR